MTALPDTTLPAAPLATWRRRLFLAFVALLPLHTVFVRGWIAWKPWLALLVVLAALHAWEGVRARSWPWHRRVSPALAVLLAALAVSWPGEHMSRFAALWLAAGVGGAVLLVAHRELVRDPAMPSRMLRAVFWSAAAMGATAIGISLAAVGAFGGGAVDAIEGLPGVLRVTKDAYLDAGFVALTNWHGDPGYAAAWMNLWAVLAFVASRRGLGSGRAWADAAVVGSLAFGVLMTLSRTGTLGLLVGISLAAWFSVRDGRSVSSVAGFTLGVVAWTSAFLGLAWLADTPGVGGDLPASFSFRVTQGLTLGPGFADDGTGSGPFDPDYRGVVWPMYLDFFRDDPLRGVGLGYAWASEGVQEPHNLVLQLLGETGLVGLAGFAVLFAAIVWRGVGRLGIVVLATTLSASMTQTVIFEPTWWFAAAIALGTGREAAAAATGDRATG
jgi:O-antigen ligase